MVTKHNTYQSIFESSSVLAKIHMVTKLYDNVLFTTIGSVLAKIHMVTKQWKSYIIRIISSVLAKIHMVTKPIQ